MPRKHYTPEEIIKLLSCIENPNLGYSCFEINIKFTTDNQVLSCKQHPPFHSQQWGRCPSLTGLPGL